MADVEPNSLQLGLQLYSGGPFNGVGPESKGPHSDPSSQVPTPNPILCSQMSNPCTVACTPTRDYRRSRSLQMRHFVASVLRNGAALSDPVYQPQHCLAAEG